MKKIFKSTFLAKLTTFSAYAWFISTVVFTYIIFASTKVFSIDPSYSAGGSEDGWLLPMLGSLFTGCFFFGLTVLSGSLRKLLKSEKWNAPLGIGAGKAALATFLIVAFAGVYVVGAFRQGISFGGGYTGQDIFNEVNKHREGVGVKPVALNEYLCDNLVERWRVAKTGEFHKGFEEWVKNEGLQSERGFKEIGEILITSPTPKDAVYWWSTSPGHKATLEAARWTDGCAYAAESTAVMVFSYR